MTNCPICFTIRESLINTEDIISTINDKISYYEERLDYLRFSGISRNAFRPYYQALDTFRALLLLYTTLLTSLETLYDRHLEYHNRT